MGIDKIIKNRLNWRHFVSIPTGEGGFFYGAYNGLCATGISAGSR